MKKIKENEKGKIYEFLGHKLYYRNKDSISGDNDTNEDEEIYLIDGKAKVTLINETKIIEAPCKILFPKNTYHKIEALTNIIFILY